MSTIGSRIAELRKNKNLSQEYVAEQLEVSRQAVSKWEQDLSSPDTKNLIALAELLGVSVEYLATGKTAVINEAPPRKEPLGVRQILGLILMANGLLSIALGILFTWLLIALGIILITFGVIFIIVPQKAIKISVSIVVLIILGLTPTIVTGINIIIAISIIFGSIAVVLTVWGIATVIKRTKTRK